MPAVKRTYASNRSLRPEIPSSPRSSYSSDLVGNQDALPKNLSAPRPLESSHTSKSLGKRKRTVSTFTDDEEAENVSVNLLKFLVPKVLSSSPTRGTKRPMTQSTLSAKTTRVPHAHNALSTPSSSKPNPSARSKTSKKALTQLHLTLGKTALRTCPLCALSYTRGAPDDEDLHKKHCARISRGAEWGREEARYEGKEVTAVEEGVLVRGPKGVEERGRIIKFNANIGGKVGAKVVCYLALCISCVLLTPSYLTSWRSFYRL